MTGQTKPDVLVSYDTAQAPQEQLMPNSGPSAYSPTPPVPADIAAGDWVAVIYDDQWWPGSVDSVSVDSQIVVSFMKPVAYNRFIWRQSSDGKCLDTDIVPMREVLAKLSEIPEPASSRHFSFSSSYAESLNDLMKSV